jgi:hypothetical protein
VNDKILQKSSTEFCKFNIPFKNPVKMFHICVNNDVIDPLTKYAVRTHG